MRFKNIFLSVMILILVGSMTAIAAADDYESLGDYTFDIPDGYQVTGLYLWHSWWISSDR